MKLYQTGRMAEEALTLCERVTFNILRKLSFSLYLKGKRGLYFLLLMFTKQAATYSSCLFKGRLLTSVIIYLLFKMAIS